MTVLSELPFPASIANTPPRGEKIVVGISGGVDSAVAALCLHRLGFDVQALFMKNWEEDDTQTYCAAEEDLADAQAVCAAIGIPLATVNLSFEYWERVFKRFLAEYDGGRTPNPDVLCNQEIKFRAFLEHAQRLGATRIATGHYAGVDYCERQGRWRLLRSCDANKDQTYFLSSLDQTQLEAAVFPLCSMTKLQVREIAEAVALPVHDKPDSTGICFIGERSMKDFLGQYLRFEPGEIVDEDGEVIGQHQGLPIYTIGQRKGLNIGGRRGSSGQAWYVAEKRTGNNQLMVVEGNNHPALLSVHLTCGAIHWTAGEPPALPLACSAQIRHRQPPQACEVAAAGQHFKVQFKRPQRAIAPGQCIAFYSADECVGSAIIESGS